MMIYGYDGFFDVFSRQLDLQINLQLFFLWCSMGIYSEFYLFSVCLSMLWPFFQAMASLWRFIFALVFLGVHHGVCGEGAGG